LRPLKESPKASTAARLMAAIAAIQSPSFHKGMLLNPVTAMLSHIVPLRSRLVRAGNLTS